MDKLAVDEAAKKYWTEYYKDLGYGEDLVRKVPRRIAGVLRDYLARTRTAEVAVCAVRPEAAYRVDGARPGTKTAQGTRPQVVFEGTLGVVYRGRRRVASADERGRAFHAFRAVMQGDRVLRAELI